MRGDGEILLLSTYELGHQPQHLASPLGFFARAGFRARAIDLAIEKLDENAVKTARFVGIAVPMHTALRLGLRAAERIRALNPKAHICFYGLYAPLHEEHLLANGADSVIGGEYESELVALVEKLENSKRGNSRLVVLDRLDFAAPQRNSLPPLSRYAKLLRDGEERLAGYVEASRGCLHLCRHCPIPPLYEGRFFVVPAELVLDDARAQVAAGARHLTFGDPDFLNGPQHGLRIARALHAEFPSLTFDITAKVEHLLKHRALLPELAALGCAFVVSAVESLNERVLQILDKGHSRADIDRAIDLCEAAGLSLRPSLVPFSPWETLDSYRALLAWISERDLIDQIDPVHLAIRLLIPPGSKLLELDETRALIGPLAASRLTYEWAHPDPRMDALQRAVYAAVETAAEAGEDPRDTFSRVRALADAAAAHRPLTVGAPARANGPRARPARLTEAWFC